MKTLLFAIVMASISLAASAGTHAASVYDGPWSLDFVTQRGPCDPTYEFSVNIHNGIVTHPNLVTFRGRVTRSGAVRASVSIHEKYASGAGRLTTSSGHGIWSGRSGGSRCSGYWTAQRN
jgi:hypothetical protein